jgi:hypothetical protein
MTPHHYPLAPYAGVWPSPHQGLPYRTPASSLSDLTPARTGLGA